MSTLDRDNTCSHCSGDMRENWRCSHGGICVSITQRDELFASSDVVLEDSDIAEAFEDDPTDLRGPYQERRKL